MPIRALTEQPSTHSHINYLKRPIILILLWYLGILIIVFYKSKLSAASVPQLRNPPKSLHDLKRAQYKFYVRSKLF